MLLLYKTYCRRHWFLLKFLETQLAAKMHYNNWCLSFLLILAVMGIIEAIVCTPNICSNAKCEVTEEDCKPNQRYNPKGGFCGCCGACITQLGPGAFCGTRFRGVPPSTECGKGLECVGNYCAFKDYGCYDSSESSEWE